MKVSERHSEASLKKGTQGDKKGRLFFTDLGLVDLTNIKIVGASVDTIRQLYHGKPRVELIERFDTHINDYIKFKLPVGKSWSNEQKYIKFDFALSRMSKVSRYRWKLQNNELGIVILIGSYFAKMDTQGQHLKIELSPKFISQRTPKTIQYILDYINNQVLNDGIAKGCAVHLACDYQNFELPQNFLDCFQTHSRIVKRYDGLNTLDITNLSESIASYGTGQNRNYLIGKASSVQMCAYDKTVEIIKSDKVDYFHSQWDAYTFGDWDKDQTVRRLEMRIPHTAVREIGEGLGENLESFLAVSEYLTDIWQYALKINRFCLDTRRKVLHPFWQLLMEDIEFLLPAKALRLVRKKKQDVTAIERNVSMLLGNIISIAARKHYTAKQIIKELKNTAFYREIKDSYRQRGKAEWEIEDFIEQGLKRRLLLGKAA